MALPSESILSPALLAPSLHLAPGPLLQSPPGSSCLCPCPPQSLLNSAAERKPVHVTSSLKTTQQLSLRSKSGFPITVTHNVLHSSVMFLSDLLASSPTLLALLRTQVSPCHSLSTTNMFLPQGLCICSFFWDIITVDTLRLTL